MTNKRSFHIAAVSLIEIMMIFSIIGIVTGACMSLNKPKNEYMTKLKVYSAFMALDAAAKTIANETHIDYTTDSHTCTLARTSTGICPNYGIASYPGMNSTLPKVVHRAAEGTANSDPGLTSTAYSTLTTPAKMHHFKYLQNGLCQRMSRTLNVPAAGIACGTGIAARHPESFTTYSPQLYLPNGQVIYFYSKLSNDIRLSSGTISTVDIYPSTYTAEEYLIPDTNQCSDIYSPVNTLFTASNTNSVLLEAPNETKVALLKAFSVCYPTNTANLAYWKKVLAKNKDYFIVYVDINGKMPSSPTAEEKQYGPDRLNVDVFAFRMYRDGTVLPDYSSGFPLTYLTSKMLVKDLTDPQGKYAYENNAYSLQPLIFSRCYANLAGSYSSGHPYDNIGICSYGGSTRAPLNDCLTSEGDSICKSIINKPSFLIR